MVGNLLAGYPEPNDLMRMQTEIYSIDEYLVSMTISDITIVFWLRFVSMFWLMLTKLIA